MKLIVGLGNPGKAYEKTRHNVGFMVIDEYVSKSIADTWKEKFNGLYIETRINDEKVIFLKPLSYMNLSGGVVKRYSDFYKILPEDILIIHDDLDLEVGRFRLRQKGSSGGHNGLKDIEANLHTNEYKRLKIGISNDKEIETKDYVLGKFSKEEIKIIEDLFPTFNNILDNYFKASFSTLMSDYNTKK